MAKYDVTIAEKSRRVQKPEIIIVIRKITRGLLICDYKELGGGTLVARPYIMESSLSWNIVNMPEKISICLNSGHMESLDFDDVSFVHACK